MPNENLIYSQNFALNTRSTLLFSGKFVDTSNAVSTASHIKNVTDLVHVIMDGNEINVSFEPQVSSDDESPEGLNVYISGFIFAFLEDEIPESQINYLILCEDVYDFKGHWTVTVDDVRYTIVGYFSEEY